MNLEDQVCSLELSEKLLTLGVKQKSIFVWEYFDKKCYSVKFIPYAVVPDSLNNFKLFPAFTVAELGEMLPPWIDIKKNEPFNIFGLQIIKRQSRNIQFIVSYECDTIAGEEVNNPLARLQLCKTFDEKEAYARAKMLIYLLENKLMELL
jgi:hypothetical protein